MTDIDVLLSRVIRDSTANLQSIHGPTHWARVERNGIFLASSVGADEHIISLFAFLHDSCRRNDGYDPEHGPRAAKYAGSIREILSGLEDAQFEILLEACNGHTSSTKTDNPTIAACWDADRLDLPRVGIRPRRSYFNTPLAIEMVTKRDFSPLESLDPRSMDTYSEG